MAALLTNLGISIHAPREGGDKQHEEKKRQRQISIHAPREGGDVIMHQSARAACISIHAPREGGDHTPIK